MNTITNVNKVGIIKKKIPIKTSPGYSIKEKNTLTKLKKNLNGNTVSNKINNCGNIIRTLKSTDKLKIGKSPKNNIVVNKNRVKK